MSIWESLNYREYLVSRLGPDGSRTGSRKKLAESIKVHTTFVSQILKERAELSLEQAELVNQFFGHTEDEGEYFILLILKDRAGSQKLKSRFDLKIQKMRDERLNIATRLKAEQTITDRDREKFYSSYVYGAVHVLSSLVDFQNIQALSEALKISRPRMTKIVEFLLSIGVLKNEGEHLKPGPNHVHLANETEMILKHHMNWRMHTISNLQFLDRDDLHYSACLTISREDAFRVKEAILQTLKANVSIIEKSPSEIPYVLSFDFYKLLA